jgi:S1-C subfamily serine protease
LSHCNGSRCVATRLSRRQSDVSPTSNIEVVIMPTLHGSMWIAGVVRHALAAFLVLGAAPHLSAQSHHAREQLPTAAIATRSLPATATITAVDASGDTIGLGSGFFLRHDAVPEGLLITNWHVMQGASSAGVLLNGGESMGEVTFIAGDSSRDVAVLKVARSVAATLEATVEIPSVGERVVAIGSPRGLSSTATEGIVSAKREISGRVLVQISAAISPGSSGGAVLDGQGRVFAIATSYLEGGQQLNFAVPASVALELIPNTIVERTLASAFAAPGAPRSGAPERGADPSAESDVYRPTDNPQASLEGVWAISQSWDGPGESQGSLQSGVLVIGEWVNALGQVTQFPDGTHGRPTTLRVRSARTTGDGEVAITIAGIDMTGYQTTQGFVAEGQFRESDDVSYSVKLYAKPIRLPIAVNSGLYDVTLRTARYRRAGSAPLVTPVTQWSGEAAVVIAGDAIGLGLRVVRESLHNDA